MAQSRSGSGKNKSSSGSRSRSSSSSRSRASSRSRKTPSRRSQRRAETEHLVRSVVLAGLGLLAVALVLVPGQNGWSLLRGWLFGACGVITYLIGPFLLYLAYLVASGYQVGLFTAKMLLMATLCASVPVVFSRFTIGDSSVWDVVKMLFAWGQTHYWAGGVLGGPIGASLLALCGRPASNFIMLLIFAMGMMIFFAVTPVDVVQFLAGQMDKLQQLRAAREASETAYDTQLFGGEPDEEPIENLTGALPDTAQTRPHRAYDVEREVLRTGPVSPVAAAPVAPPAPARPSFDVDLGPDVSAQALQNAVENDPLEPVIIGPGGTFGLDPLSHLSTSPQKRTEEAPPAEQTGQFELRLDAGENQVPAPSAAAAAVEDELDHLINRAMYDYPQQTAQPDLPEEAEPLGEFETPLEPVQDFAAPAPAARVPGDTVAIPLAAVQNAAPIPTIGGSFDTAAAAWNAGVPMASVLAGQPAAPVAESTQEEASSREPAPARQDSPFDAPPKQGEAARLRVSTAVGNSAAPPVSSPPNAAKASPEAIALAEALREPPKPYCYPSLNLFNATRPEDEVGAVREMKKNADILVNTLDSFGVKTRILDICRGPSVTRYELQPQAGIKVSRITSLADDIALNLATAGVRIEAPIPGKPAVGIEVPNKIRATVGIRSVFESQNYINMRSPLTMALGRDIAGTAQVADLCKMPHLLIAGSTGSGKSVCVNSIIISFLFRSSPEDVKLILIDPKVVELAEYNGIPHLLMPVVTEPRKAAGALGASVAEMERRYKLFAENNVREIKAYNKLAAQNPMLEHMPYIAIVIDELADLMMVAGKEVEDYICRIAQKARAAGIHLIVATQRPSVDVITGLMKANIPSRIAFAVSSQIDSRTILDGAGAEKLLGNGDMLFLPVGAAKPARVQGTFVTDEEIGAVLDFIKSTSDAQYDEEMIAEMERRAVAEKGSKKGADADEEGGGALDPMFEQAVECVIEAGQASTSLLQRRCKLGYARAARIMDQMEQEKVIGPYEGAKPRAVLLTRAQWQERKLSAQYDEN
ncbi:MAG: DNA translocase FtsK [Gemmiger sp.]